MDAFRGYATNNTVCIFTSGISDSLCKDTKIFQNEQDLLIDTLRNNTDKLCVFLSSCSIYDTTLADSDYVKHTLKMEDYIQRSGNRFLILRKPNLVGKRQENSSTIINYLARKIQNNEEFVVWSEAKRNFLDIEDFLKVATYLIDNQIFNNTSINIANTKNSDILEVVELLEDAL